MLKIKIMLATLAVLMASYPLSGCGENATDTRENDEQYGIGQYLAPRGDSDDDSASETQYEVTLERTSLPDTGGGAAEQ